MTITVAGFHKMCLWRLAGWLAVLQMVPWRDVITNAPKVGDGAKKLWNAVSDKPPSAQPADTGTCVQLSSQRQAIAALQAQVLALQRATQALHEQMPASSELIMALAEQNTQLISRAGAKRARLLLAGVTAVVTVLAVIAVTPVLTS